MIILTHRVVYTAGEPFARFASTRQAAAWLRSVGYRMTCRIGGLMLFES